MTNPRLYKEGKPKTKENIGKEATKTIEKEAKIKIESLSQEKTQNLNNP